MRADCRLKAGAVLGLARGPAWRGSAGMTRTLWRKQNFLLDRPQPVEATLVGGGVTAGGGGDGSTLTSPQLHRTII